MNTDTLIQLMLEILKSIAVSLFVYGSIETPHLSVWMLGPKAFAETHAPNEAQIINILVFRLENCQLAGINQDRFIARAGFDLLL